MNSIYIYSNIDFLGSHFFIQYQRIHMAYTTSKSRNVGLAQIVQGSDNLSKSTYIWGKNTSFQFGAG